MKGGADAVARPEGARSGSPGAAGEQRSSNRLRELVRRLKRAYGPPEKPRRDPLDELVHTILSQNTTDTNRDRAWEDLWREFEGWDEVRTASPERLREAIRTAGLARQKAATIHRVLNRLHEKQGELRLDHLRQMDDDEALSYLSDFKGVGVKTAACVLCFSLRRPVLPVDTHVYRVSRRLGLVPEGSTRRSAHRVLNREVPPELRFALHLLLIRHGRDTCTARSPDCPGCPLESVCPQVGVA